MSRVAYVNGRYLPHADAVVNIEDRGYQFADGVYEVVALYRSRFVDLDDHLRRLWLSLDGLSITAPMGDAALRVVLRELARRNRVSTGYLYLQITRGVAPRAHAIPANMRPSLVITARRGLGPAGSQGERGIEVITLPDPRWNRCDIKSVSLLANIMVKRQAILAGAQDAWMVGPDGTVTEASAANAWIVDQDGRLVTRPLGHEILSGVTRKRLISLAGEAGIPVLERPFTVEEACRAREAFISGSTSLVVPVVRVDDQPIGNGHPGSITRALQDLYWAYLEQLAA